jgi:NADPH-dependent glutamate synthase beta subunit-like oxidoreductase/2,4-dienoyl-CoA reductase-like NADH-dependent reductase (Old Yellow Enzyme family)
MKVNNPNIFLYRGIHDLQQDIARRSLDIPLVDDVPDNLALFRAPVDVEGKVIPNRFCLEPMEGCDGGADGSPGPLTFRKYNRFAAGGSGLIWVEATAVVPEGRANPRQLMLTEQNKEQFKQLVADIRSNARDEAGQPIKPFLVLQLTHSGRYSKPEGKAVPLIIYHSPVLDPTHQLPSDYPLVSDEYLDQLQNRFVAAAELANECGFDAVDVKSCHGYLLHELLSAHTRQDSKYGGSLANRTRFLRETVRRIKEKMPRLIVTTRLDIYDAYPYPYGWGMKNDGSLTPDLAEPRELVRQLAELGVTMFNFTFGNPYFNPFIGRPFDYPSQGGALSPEHPLVTIERNIRLTREMARSFPALTIIAVSFSWLRELFPHIGAALLKNRTCSILGIGRLGLANPNYANELFKTGQIKQEHTCITCSSCTQIMRDGGMSGCVIRDSLYEPIYREGRRKNEQYMRELAQECRNCWGATCKGDCPAGVDASAFIRAFEQGDLKESYEIIARSNALPEASSFTCPAEDLCERSCTKRTLEGTSIPIQAIQRFVAQTARQRGYTKVTGGPANGKKVAVIGFGPAGIACTIELIKQGFQVEVFEAAASGAGGIADAVIPRYRLPDGTFAAEIAAFELEKTGLLTIHYNQKLGAAFSLPDLLAQGFAAVFIGAGLGQNNGLPIAEKPAQVYPALAFLQDVKKNRFDLGKVQTAAVIGGGNTAMDAAYSLKEYGVRNVYLLYRRSFLEFPAWLEEIEKTQQMGVHFLILSQPVGYETKSGDPDSLAGVRIARTMLGEPDASGRCAPIVLEGSEYVLPVDLCVEAVGQSVPDELVQALPGVAFRNGKIVVDDHLTTTCHQVYAGGDIINGGSTVIQAVADGRKAALAIACQSS